MLMLIPDVGMRMNRASEERLRHMAIEHVTDEHAAETTASEDNSAVHSAKEEHP